MENEICESGKFFNLQEVQLVKVHPSINFLYPITKWIRASLRNKNWLFLK